MSHLDLLVPDSGHNESWIMLVGENGVGKSSLLQGVALALAGERRANELGLNAADFVRRGSKEGFVHVHVSALDRLN
jgi:DNA repair exonuclease SbcCD ATPase subunit